MKKTARAIFLSALLVLVLSVSAMALDAPTAPGIYDAAGENGITITPAGEAESAIVEDDFVDFYPNAETLTVSYADAASGSEYLILVTDTETTAPTAENIVYIDQATATADGVSFTVYPSALTAGEYYVYLSSNASDGYGSEGLAQVGTFSYYQMPYKLGDVDGENGLNSYDASLILQNLVGTYDFVGNGALAADVDGENGINSYDASLILQHLVGTYTIPGWEE